MQRVQVIDSHTGGEPTRIVVAGGPDLGGGSVADKLKVFRSRHDKFRSAVVNEPRGSDVLVGGLLTEPSDSSCAAGVIFFNNVGYLGMCGHGAIGLVATLAHQGRLKPGDHRIETPVGVITARLHESGEVSVQNVPSYRLAKSVSIKVEGHGSVTGDIAWGGNWFYLVNEHGQNLSLTNVEKLTDFTWRIRQTLTEQNITGRDGQEIDHIELFGPSKKPGVHSKNFVLCPGKAYDRSPCGTGTSAKLACLFAEGKLKEGEVWRQESITGSVFEGSVRVVNGEIIPTIKGSAFVNAEATLLLNAADPCCWGFR
jgi:4-hydroxyproline epimerase